MLDDFVVRTGGPFWVLLLLLVAAVVLSTRKQITARVAPPPQSQEIYLPESDPESDQPIWQEQAPQPTVRLR